MNVTIALNPNADLTAFKLLSLLPTIITVVAVFGAYILGKWLGIISVILAFFSGLIMVQFPFAGIILYLISAGIAYVAVINIEQVNNNNYYYY